jgi:uncharacterized protein YeaO (DUF488 family)
VAIHLKRAYEPSAPEDGFRILVDRLWPRGIARDAAHVDLWLKEIAPSTELRKWFAHDPEKWAEFRKRYAEELDSRPAEVERLAECVRRGTVTLVYGAKDQQHNQAVALKEYLEESAGRKPGSRGRRA